MHYCYPNHEKNQLYNLNPCVTNIIYSYVLSSICLIEHEAQIYAILVKVKLYCFSISKYIDKEEWVESHILVVHTSMPMYLSNHTLLIKPIHHSVM